MLLSSGILIYCLATKLCHTYHLLLYMNKDIIIKKEDIDIIKYVSSLTF